MRRFGFKPAWTRLESDVDILDSHSGTYVSTNSPQALSLRIPSQEIPPMHTLTHISQNLTLFEEQLSLIDVEARTHAISVSHTHSLTQMLEEAVQSAHVLSAEINEMGAQVGPLPELLAIERDFKESLQKLRGLIRFCMAASPRLSTDQPSVPRTSYGSIPESVDSAWEDEDLLRQPLTSPSLSGGVEMSYQFSLGSAATDHSHSHQQQQQQQQMFSPTRVITDETYERERQAQVVEVEKDVRELTALFKDVATMVDAQQAHIDTLEDNIESTVQLVHKANKQLTAVTKSKRRLRSRRVCVVAFLITAATIIFLAFYLPGSWR